MTHLTQPLPDTHPELTIHRSAGALEFRITRRCRRRSATAMTVLLASIPMMLLGAGIAGLPRPYSYYFALGSLLCYAGYLFNKVHHDSLILIPPHGLQLETHTGPPPSSYFFRFLGRSTKLFIHLSAFKLLFIHEGLYSWNVRYFLAVQHQHRPDDPVQISVVFPNTLPYFPVLKVVYQQAMDELRRFEQHHLNDILPS